MSPRPIPLATCLLLGALASVSAQVVPDVDDRASPGSVSVQARPLPGPDRPNILVLLADDFGVDVIGAYDEHPATGRTPILNHLATQGLLFRNAWATPGCSPTRAMMLTGRYPSGNGVGFVIDYDDHTWELDPATTTIADLLAPTYRTGMVGKWHLAASQVTGPSHALQMGFEHHWGAMSNLPPGSPDSFFEFDKAVDGVLVPTVEYATTDSVDDALSMIASFGDDPWFVWLSFNAPHAPYHKPPEALHSYTLPEEITGNIPVHALAMGEAMDTEIGRLLVGLGPAIDDTYVIFLGDNGTAGPATSPPWDPGHAKITFYEGGLNVPLIVRGPGVVQGQETTGLVSAVDVFATVAELAGVDGAAGSDSVSFAPYFADPDRPSLRPWVYSEGQKPNGPPPWAVRERAVRGDRYKLIYRYDATNTVVETEFYDLISDPFEVDDLLVGDPLTPGQQFAFDGLASVMDDLDVLAPPPDAR